MAVDRTTANVLQQSICSLLYGRVIAGFRMIQQSSTNRISEYNSFNLTGRRLLRIIARKRSRCNFQAMSDRLLHSYQVPARMMLYCDVSICRRKMRFSRAKSMTTSTPAVLHDSLRTQTETSRVFREPVVKQKAAHFAHGFHSSVDAANWHIFCVQKNQECSS